jgi:hypothetical protein
MKSFMRFWPLWLFLSVLAQFVPAFVKLAHGACPKGTVEHEGTCASMPSPDESALAPLISTSDEQPPVDKMPSYEREGIRAEMPSSLAAQDAKLDLEKSSAEQAGKKAAGLE